MIREWNNASVSQSVPVSRGRTPVGDAPETIEAARWLAPGCTAAAISLGVALQVSNGFLHTLGLALVTLAIGLTVVAVTAGRPAGWARRDGDIVRVLAAVGLLLHGYYLLSAVPGFYVAIDATGWWQFRIGVVVLSALTAVAIARPSLARPHVLAFSLVAAHAALGVWVMHRSPDPAIDVHLFQKYAVAALRHGENPYSLTFPDIYNNSGFYGEGLSVNGRLQFGFPYFPLSLLAAVPGQLLGQDPRYSQLTAIELAALLMAFARPGGLGVMAAALYLTTPRTFFVLEQSWTEPFVVLGLAAVVFAACRRSRLTPWLFGGFIAIKQYLVFALPAAALLATTRADLRSVAGVLWRGAVIGTAITLPFALWDPDAFVRSVVTLQFRQPFRGDALSYLAWWAGRGHGQPSTAISFALAAAASALALWRLPRTAAGFSAAVALTFFVFFALNKQAFANYYFFVVGALYVTVAAWRPAEPSA